MFEWCSFLARAFAAGGKQPAFLVLDFKNIIELGNGLLLPFMGQVSDVQQGTPPGTIPSASLHQLLMLFHYADSTFRSRFGRFGSDFRTSTL